jgi:hyperosmotically inducible periplasmic protein
MVRGLLRLVLILLVVVAAAAFFFGYRWGTGPAVPAERPVATTGAPEINTSRARQAGAEIGEKVAVGANKAEQAIADATLTTKIKSKMALDDTIKARRIDVDTDGTVVTLTGSVETAVQKTRALQLARETDGVTSVVDRLRVE